jgi:two-component system phosphate regulon response regulator PhoB/two-component system alkaline phosphatase synthesis response regulator PhoP
MVCSKVKNGDIGGKQSMNKLIAVIDDEPDIVNLVSLHLQKGGFRTKEFLDVDSFYRFLKSEVPDLIVLDLMLPDTDGYEVCKHLKKQDAFASVPIIMLTARAEESERILGLELGADDYVTKPFSPRELVARVKAVLRRHKPEDQTKKITVSGMMNIDLEKYEVDVSGKRVDLTSTEFRILQLFVSKKGWVFSREKILQHLWGDDKMVLDRTVDVHIKHLREKLGPASKFIKNIRGVGYKLEE